MLIFRIMGTTQPLRPSLPRYSVGEEIASSVSHGLGVILSIVGLCVLVAVASLAGSVRSVVSCSVFGACLVMLYTSSTLYHAIPLVKAKRVLRILDHSSIYLLIAGTYTPFALLALGGSLGWTLFGAIWTLALAGVVTTAVTHTSSCRAFKITLSLLMGWIVVAVIKPMLVALQSSGFTLLLLGGIIYTAGLAFYGWRRLPYNHFIWHLFVLGGSILHFFTILLFVDL